MNGYDWPEMIELYEKDTFFHLSLTGRIGLVILSATMAGVIIFTFVRFTKNFAIPVRLGLTVVTLWLFIWLSPQIYYLYYIQIISGLPMQNVIQWPPSLVEILQTIFFGHKSNLSNHAKGVLFWAMVFFALSPKRETKTAAR